MPRYSDENIRLLCKRIANFLAVGRKPEEIAKEVGFNHKTIRKYMHHPYTQAELKDVALELNQFKQKLRDEVSKLSKEVIDTIKGHLEKKNLKAVEIIMDIMQLKNDKEENKDTQISVHLDLGESQPKVIKGETIEIQDRRGETGIPDITGEES